MLSALAYFCLGAPPALSYPDFAERGDSVRAGMTKSAVVAILGRPDAIWTEHDPFPFEAQGGGESWAWGTTERYSFPTRGEVEFDRSGKVGRINLPKVDSIKTEWKDGEIAQALTKIHRIFHPGGPFSNAAEVRERIRLVNYCVSLGEDRAITALSLYENCSNSDNESTISEVLHLLYPSTFSLLISKEVPYYYPMVLIDDVPLDIDIFFKQLGGRPSQSRKIVDSSYRKRPFRSRRIEPTSDPFGLAERVKARPEWSQVVSRSESKGYEIDPRHISSQIYGLTLRCLDLSKKRGPEVFREVEAKGVHWSHDLQDYVRNDGFYRPDATVPTPYKRIVWLPGPGNLQLVVQRSSPQSLVLSFDQPETTKRKPMRFKYSDRTRTWETSLDVSEEIKQSWEDNPRVRSQLFNGTIYSKFFERAIGPVTLEVDPGYGPTITIHVPELTVAQPS